MKETIEKIGKNKKVEKNTGNQSLIRGLRLIDILSQFPNGCPLAQIATLADLNKTTVHRLLQGLQQEGFVQTSANTGSYRLTSKCLTIGHKIFSSMNIINIAAPYLEELNLALGETVNFSMLEGDHAIMLYKLEPTIGMLRTRAYIGQHLALYCSAMGKLYLAYKPNFLQKYWKQNQDKIQRFTDHTITELSLMESEIQDILTTGFALDREENELGVSCIACPIFDYQHKIAYAVSVSLSTARLKQWKIEDLIAKIQQASKGISKELGYLEE